MELLIACLITFVIGLYCFPSEPEPFERGIDRELCLAAMDAQREAGMATVRNEFEQIDREMAELREQHHWRQRNEDLRWDLLLLSLNNDARAKVRAMPAEEQLEFIPEWTAHLVEHALDKTVGWALYTAPFSLEEWIALQRNAFTQRLCRPFEGPLGWYAPWREQVATLQG
jgi:hypothetical protein